MDQLDSSGGLICDVDSILSESVKDELLLAALPGATVEKYYGVRVVRYRNQVILRKQITHLGNPWPPFKKRIQIPQTWIAAERQARGDGLVPRFIGIYHYGLVTIFTDFDPDTYVKRKANNSAAHLATNDLFQALTAGQFSRVDRNGNRLTSVRADEFEAYVQTGYDSFDPRLEIMKRFNAEFLATGTLDALDATKQMHAAGWPHAFQGEWPGFYLEYRLAEYIRHHGVQHTVAFQQVKNRGVDYDLVFERATKATFFGDLKASDVTKHEAPGNDAEDIMRCVEQFGRFWYVIYEHRTVHARDRADVATIAWNEWRRSVGHKGRREFDPLSYSRRFKESVRFVRMMVLEVNQANFQIVLGEFAQGKQPNGASRALKVMINKRNIDNFLIYSESVDAS